MALALGSCAHPPASQPAPLLIGADVSALPVFEQHGVKYRKGGAPRDGLVLLREAGMNCFRLRLFVAPNHEGVVTNDLDYTLALAKRVKASGATLMLDFHYSDTWADPGKQYKPAAWAQLPFDALVTTMGDYTRETLARFAREGVTPDYVQIGNEITNGLLWPDGRVEFAEGDKDPAPWQRLERLLRAGIDAVPVGQGQPKILLQVENPGQKERSLWFLRHVRAAGLRYDLIGMSYYPEWHGSLVQLRDTLTTIAGEFRKPIIVVETAYPWKNDEHWRDAKHLDWPLTPAGQEQFLKDVLAVVRALPDGLGRGVCYWHPESVSSPSFGAWLDGSCALFDNQGEILPGAAFGRALP